MKNMISSALLAGAAIALVLWFTPETANAQIFVANNGTNTISEYTTSGALVNYALVSGLSSPYGIAVSGTKLFVANSYNGTIGEYTTSGATVNAA